MAIEPYIILIIIAAVLTVCMPFFVLKIRNQVVDINKKLSVLIDILQKENAPPGETHSHTATQPQATTRYEKLGFAIGRSFNFVLIGLAAMLFGAWVAYMILIYFN
ncbi:MAG: hypothetical protein H8D67_18845 [Deltaproteobacteria bacterium]|nr:hypothetical protein [Deltaproteobacteria bacterium]